MLKYLHNPKIHFLPLLRFLMLGYIEGFKVRLKQLEIRNWKKTVFFLDM